MIPTNLFSDLYLAKFLDISAKPCTRDKEIQARGTLKRFVKYTRLRYDGKYVSDKQLILWR